MWLLYLVYLGCQHFSYSILYVVCYLYHANCSVLAVSSVSCQLSQLQCFRCVTCRLLAVISILYSLLFVIDVRYNVLMCQVIQFFSLICTSCDRCYVSLVFPFVWQTYQLLFSDFLKVDFLVQSKNISTLLKCITFIVWVYTSQDFVETLQHFTRLHDRRTVSFRSSGCFVVVLAIVCKASVCELLELYCPSLCALAVLDVVNQLCYLQCVCPSLFAMSEYQLRYRQCISCLNYSVLYIVC